MSLLADAECPKVDFENVELKENNENGKVIEVGKEKPSDKCKRLFCDNKLLVLLICLILVGVILGIVLGFIIGNAKKERIIGVIPTNYRLPGNIVPKHYVLEVQPYIIPNHFTFDGKVEILVTCVEETDKVFLHSKDLTIKEDDIRVRNMNDDSNIRVSEVEYNETKSFLILHLSVNMEKDKEYTIFLSFHGKLQKSGKGFYISTYYDENRDIHYVASTQYEAIYAREGFPCFDEPEFKATFEITLVRWRNMSSLSNMPRVKTVRRGKDWVADTFLTSLRMSSYTVAYYVGEYVGKIENKVRVWAPKHKAEFVDFSLDIGNKFLEYFEEKIGIPYSPPKLDMVPVTELVAAAMENWGLIIYTDNQLFYNEERKNAETRQTIATTVAHEIAHQWFGNLVTPKWWSSIWLSEGMTTYMENVASMHFYPEWNEIDKTIKFLYDMVYEKDCLDEFSMTVWKNITAESITLPGQTFGTLTYMKGAMIGRMMHYILGNDTFWRGISAYMKEFSYRNVEEKDLWKYLTEAQFGKNKIDMAETMWSWTHISGAPIVTVKRDYNRETITFTQNTCKIRNPEQHASDLWHVPISYTTARKPEWNPGIQTWLTGRNMTMKDVPNNVEWLLLNGNSVGYYLVNYDKRNWGLLAQQLRNNHEVFSVDQRYKILADANLLYKYGYIDIEIVLDLSSYLGNEKFLDVFSYPNSNFIKETKSAMEFSSYGDYWREYMTSILAPIEEALGWEINADKELRHKRQLRADANHMLCQMDYPPCVIEAVRRFHVFRLRGDNQTVVTIFNREYILCAAVRSGPSEVTDYFVNQYTDNDRLTVLACSENETIIEYVFDNFDDGWKQQHYSAVVQLMKNRRYWRKFLEFLDDHLENTEDDSNVYSWFMAIRRSVSSLDQKEKFREVISNHIHKLNEDEKLVMNEILKRDDEETKLKEKVEKIGEWLEMRIWTH